MPEGASERVSYREVREYLEARGWVLKETWPPYHVFFYIGDSTVLPRLIEVHDRTVNRAIFERIKREFGE